jgi:hypothetical protein
MRLIVETRAERVRGRLKKTVKKLEGGKRKHVVVFTYGVFMQFLS